MSTGSHLFSLDTPTGVHLEGERSGSGVPLILLHGLTATRRYVVMGSRHLARAGAELIAFDARGHGESGPAPDPAAYEYADLVADLEAVVHALRVVPRSVAFEGLEALGRLEIPALVVGSRDDSDPGHPLELARAYAEALPGARLLVEEPGESPLAWQGAQLSRAIEGFLREAGVLGSGEQQR